MRYRVEIDRKPRAEFARWMDALRFAKAAAAANEERTVQVIETGELEELILSMRHGYLAITGNYSYTLPEERAAVREEAKRGIRRPDRERPRVELNDEEHELILDNPEADAYIADQAVRRAIEGGMDPEMAERLYRSKEQQ
jgi:hypothetical protein